MAGTSLFIRGQLHQQPRPIAEGRGCHQGKAHLGLPGRVGSTPPVVRSALYSLLLPPFGVGSVTVFDPAPL
jgi:hypothetical protein